MSLLLRRRALLSRLKGYLRHVSGVPPLNLFKCLSDNSVVTYRIDGNIGYDNSAPSQDNPSYVESVGVRTRNLFDIDNANISGTSASALAKPPRIENGVIYSGGKLGSSEGACIFIDTLGNDNITISFDCSYAETETTRRYRCYLFNEVDQNNCVVDVNRSDLITPNNKNTVLVNTTGYKYVGIVFFSDTQYGLEITNLQFEQGTEATEYEPYGYKIPLVASSKNIFDGSWKKGTYLTSTGAYVSSSSNRICSSNYVEVKPNTTYTMSFPQSSVDNSVIRLLFHRNDETFISSLSSVKTFTTPEACEKLHFYIADDRTTESAPVVQIEEGSTPTEYESYVQPITTSIYLDRPLRRIGSYADYIDFKNSKVVRQVNEYTLSSNLAVWSEDTSTKSGGKVFRTSVSMLPLIGANIADTFMTHFSLTDMTSTSDFTPCQYRFMCDSNLILGSALYVAPTQTTLEDFVLWLQENEAKVYYPITDVEQSAELPQLPTFKDQTTIYTVDSTLLPSSMEITYHSKESE